LIRHVPRHVLVLTSLFALLAFAIPPMTWTQSGAADAPEGKTFGSKSAPITMVVYSDFQCPSCRELYENALRPLMNDYVPAGKVYLVHRDFPLSMHRYSKIAARYANAAARIGKYAQVEAALYDNQAAWSLDGNMQKYIAAALTPAEMKRVEHLMEGCHEGDAGVAPAKMGGGTQTHGCAFDASIEKDMALGNQVPVHATPTFVISCKNQSYPASGRISYPILKQYFDEVCK
jgi:protein-disulfide isomerase